MNHLILYASGLIIWQTLRTLEERRAIPQIKLYSAEIRSALQPLIASGSIKV